MNGSLLRRWQQRVARTRLARWKAVFLVLTVLLAARVPAQESPPVQPETLLFQDEIVNAASKYPEPAREAPTTVTLVSKEELRRFGYRTLAEALRSVAGFYSSNDRSYSSLGVRGFQRPGDFSDRVLLLINGHTVNDDVFQHAPIGEDFGVDIEAIERIEVVRGPGAAIYGGNALFAVINVVTISGVDAPGIRMRAETGSFWRKRGMLSFGHTTAGGLDVFATGSVLDVDGDDALFYPAYDAPAFNHGVAEDADRERAYKFYLQAHYGPFSLQANTAGREKHIPTAPFGATFNDPGSKIFDQRGFVELQYHGTLLADLTVDARVYYDYLRTHTTLIYGAAENPIKNETRATSDWLGSELRLRYPTVWRQTFSGGVEYSYHPNATQRNFDLPYVSYLDDRRSFHNVGVYLQDEIRLLPSLTLIAGGRFDHQYDKIDEWSPRVAAVWKPRDSTVIKLLYGTAFRAPNLFESYHRISQGSFNALANPNLDSEHITTYEAAIEEDLWGVARLTLSGFHDEIDDLISQVSIDTAGGTPTSQYQNRDSVDANGMEAALRVPLPRRMAARAAYSFQVTRLPGDRRLINSPEHLGNLGLLFPVLFGIDGAAELFVIGPRDTGDGKRLETVPLVNLNFVYEVRRYDVDLSAGFYNIFDQSYRDPAGVEYLQDSIPQDEFTFRVQVGYGF